MIGASLQALFGAKISLYTGYTGLAERAREETYELMVEHAQQMGANTILAMRSMPMKSPTALPRFWPTERRSLWSRHDNKPANLGVSGLHWTPGFCNRRRAAGPQAFWPPHSLPEECSSIG